MITHEIFIQYYSKLCDTLTEVDELLPECVTERIVSVDLTKEIYAIASTKKKVEKLLEHIVGPLQAGYTEELLVFLKIMKRRGSRSTVQLANELENLLFTGGDGVVNNDNDKGVSQQPAQLENSVDVVSIITKYWKTKPVGGYDCTFVEIPQERLVCNICKLPCREAQISGCCGYAFCKVCLEKLRELTGAKYSCPHCHSFEFSTFPHKEADRQIKALEVYCPNKNKGCQWTGKLNDIGEHIVDGKCHDLECDKCKEIIPHTALKSHFIFCPCYCPFCKITAEKEVISSKHKAYCTEFPVSCTDCGKSYMFRDFDEHFDTCPDKIIHCTYYSEGCTSTFPRHKQRAHNAKNRCNHFLLLFSRLAIILNAFTVIYGNLSLLNNNRHLEHQITITDKKVEEIFQSLEPLQMNSLSNTLLSQLLKQTITGLPLHELHKAPVIFRLSNFSEDFESKYDYPFFAFEGGYQMCLRVDAAGYRYGEDNYVSVFLYLMKGPHDDELQLSGYWPLHGNFTIELLNQLDNNKHHSYTISLNYDVCKFCTYRVHKLWSYVSSTAFSGYEIHRFIPHDLIYQNNSGYVVNNTVYFRITYEDTEYQPSDNYYVTEYFLWPLMSTVVNWCIFVGMALCHNVWVYIFILWIFCNVYLYGFIEGMVGVINCIVFIWICEIVNKKIVNYASGHKRLYMSLLLGNVVTKMLFSFVPHFIIMNRYVTFIQVILFVVFQYGVVFVLYKLMPKLIIVLLDKLINTLAN